MTECHPRPVHSLVLVVLNRTHCSNKIYKIIEQIITRTVRKKHNGWVHRSHRCAVAIKYCELGETSKYAVKCFYL
jgi:hypothetical protein